MKKLTQRILIVIIIALCSTMFLGLSNNLGWNIEKIHADKVWKITKGQGQTIAFVDTGISPELAKRYSGRVVYQYNVIKNINDCTDINGHGTEMVSAACGSGQNGIWGVAPDSKIMIICAIDEQGHATAENISKGIYLAIENHATIINLSLGTESEDECIKKAIAKAISNNIYVVASAGDYGNPTLLFPSNISNVISVEAQDALGNIYINSNYSDKATIAIPGCAIPVLSVDSEGKLFAKKEDGTSVATAQVSGLIALSLSINNKLSQNELISDLKNSVDKTKFINSIELINSLKPKN